MKPLLVVAGVCAGDAQCLTQTLDWCAKLGPQPADLVVITDGEMDDQWNAGGFLSKRIIPVPPPDPALYATLSAVVQHHETILRDYPGRPYLMLESDSIPLTGDWVLGLLEGHGPDLLNTMSGNRVLFAGDAAWPFFNGVGIYPARYRVPEIPQGVLWGVDRTNCRRFHPTLNFRENERMVHVWGDELGHGMDLKNKAPTFPTLQSLDTLRFRHPSAVLFHRCKDGTLIERLRQPPLPMTRADLADVFTRLGLKIGLELGVCVGQFSETLLSRWDGHLHLVDGWDGPFPGWPWVPQDGPGRMEETRRRTANWSHRVSLHQGWSPTVASQFVDRSLDWVYIDANHSYAAALADLEAWYPKLRLGGVISGHDYQDSFEAYNKPMEVPESQRHLLTEYGVKSAVKEFRRRQCITAPLRVTDESDDHVRSFWWIKEGRRVAGL